MAAFDQQEFNEFVLEQRAIEFRENPVPLSSGRQSHFYVNWKKISDVALTSDLATFIMDFADDHHLHQQTFYGVPEGASKIALITQFRYATERAGKCAPGTHVLAMGRGKEKDRGDAEDRFFLGFPKGRTVVIEDVTTTGESLLSTIDLLVHLEASVIAAISLTDRNERSKDGKSVEQVVRERGVEYLAMSNAYDLLPLAYKRYTPPREIAHAVEREFAQHGAKPLILL